LFTVLLKQHASAAVKYSAMTTLDDWS